MRLMWSRSVRHRRVPLALSATAAVAAAQGSTLTGTVTAAEREALRSRKRA